VAIDVLTILCALAACHGQPEQSPTYSITIAGAGNRVTYRSRGAETAFDVRSEMGIGLAAVEQTAGDAPTKIIIRLHLRGLEEFTFEYDEIAVIVSVSSHGDQAVTERVRKAGAQEVPIGPDSPYWMPVRVAAASASGGGNSTGSFELDAPQDFLQGKHSAFSMRWIDFYR
jgi:hypothetical protein